MRRLEEPYQVVGPVGQHRGDVVGGVEDGAVPRARWRARLLLHHLDNGRDGGVSVSRVVLWLGCV